MKTAPKKRKSVHSLLSVHSNLIAMLPLPRVTHCCTTRLGLFPTAARPKRRVSPQLALPHSVPLHAQHKGPLVFHQLPMPISRAQNGCPARFTLPRCMHLAMPLRSDDVHMPKQQASPSKTFMSRNKDHKLRYLEILKLTTRHSMQNDKTNQNSPTFYIHFFFYSSTRNNPALSMFYYM